MNLTQYMHHECWVSCVSLQQYIKQELQMLGYKLSCPEFIPHECWLTALNLAQYIHYEFWVIGIPSHSTST